MAERVSTAPEQASTSYERIWSAEQTAAWLKANPNAFLKEEIAEWKRRIRESKRLTPEERAAKR